MSGDDVKRQVRSALALSVAADRREASNAFAPCIVLTAEEQEKVRRPLLDALSDDHLRGDVDAALDILTPNQEAKV